MEKGSGDGKPAFERRKFLKIVAVAGAAGALYHLQPWELLNKGAVVRESRIMMGTQINLIVCGPDKESCYEAVDTTLSRMAEVASVLSRHSSTSELSVLNQTGAVANPSSDLYSVLSLAQDIARMTAGAFDVTILPLLALYDKEHIPEKNTVRSTLDLVDYTALKVEKDQIAFGKKGMGVTLDGIGKGYAVDQGVEALQQAGFPNVYVEAGGDLMVTGSKPKQEPWRIGIRNPRPEHPDAMLSFEIKQPMAVATSGDYMQWFTRDRKHHHIIDPRTGRSPLELASATVTGPNVVLADGLATAAMVLGPEKTLALLETTEQCEGLLFDKELRRYQTSGFTV
ncbi:MAG: twin-arginine translocation pathway signal protein [Desulfobulbus propionicus]|nr:MAG: twin-arginine translocation pathway signal protein [Desulfobulbus propionicus]PIE63864.1 MAG: twin-arginine translocation pathway signal protein [Desulfobacterales bacterium]